MKFSFIIAALIIALVALIAVPRHRQIKTLVTEIEDLRASLGAPGQSENRRVSFDSANSRAARQKKFDADVAKLIAFAHASQTSGDLSSLSQAERKAEAVGWIKVIDLLSKLNPEDLRLMTQMICADPSRNQDAKFETLHFITYNLSKFDPESALVAALEARKGLDIGELAKDTLFGFGLLRFSAKDPMAAAQWLVDHESELTDMSSSLKCVAVRNAARQDIGTAIGLIKTLKLGPDKNVYANIAGTVTPENADSFLAAIRDSDANADQREGALKALTRSPLMQDFEAATTWLDGPGLTVEEHEKITRMLGYRSVKNQPEKWLDWLASREKYDNSQTTKNIITEWTRNDFVATGEWLNSRPAGDQKNQAIQTYAEALALHEPAAAAEWAATLPDSPERSALLKSIGNRRK